MRSMDCNDVRRLLFAYLDGELDGDPGDIEEHFEDCFPCYRRVTLEKAFIKLIKAKASGRPVPGGLESRVRKEIETRASAGGWRGLGRQPLFLLAAAALLLTAVGFAAMSIPSFSAVGSAHASTGPAPGAREGTIRGTLVCIGCMTARAGGRKVLHAHRNGVLTRDGRLWHILDTRVGEELIYDHNSDAQTVTLEGTIYPSAQTVSVTRYTFENH